MTRQRQKKALSDIGYYRLGFYWYPFEENVEGERTHVFKKGANFKSAVDLYCFDNDMRNILLSYIQIVEVNFRTCLVYEISNQYKNDPIWFSNTVYVSRDFVANFSIIYNNIKKNPIIQKHNREYPTDIYAPAWKTLLFCVLTRISAAKIRIIFFKRGFDETGEQLAEREISAKPLPANESGIETAVLIIQLKYTISPYSNDHSKKS